MSVPKVDPEPFIRALKSALAHLRTVERNRNQHERESLGFELYAGDINRALRIRREHYTRLEEVVGEQTATVLYHHLNHNSYTGDE